MSEIKISQLRRRIANRMPRLMLISALVASASLSSGSANEIPAGMAIQDLSVWPSRIHLKGPADVAQILITGKIESGQQIDLTRTARFRGPSDAVAVSPRGQIRPLADGAQRLTFDVGSTTVEVNAIVSGMATATDVSYVRDVSPSMSRMGCNSGTCHGAKDGQRGFKLSLRGYDFEFDHRAITDDIAARRFNRASPDQSLILLKTSGAIPHVGGVLTGPGQRRYEILRRWIENGAPLDLEAPRVTSIAIHPDNPILPRANVDQQMIVLATYSDGTVRDVTVDAFIECGNIEVLSADKSGLVRALRRGESPVLARYEGAYVATTVTVMGDRKGFTWDVAETNNYIDELVYNKLQRVKIPPSDLCTDEEFIRRVFLDLTGLLPSSGQVREFLADDRPTRTKRDELIDQLIGDPEYVEHWTNKWADMLQVNRKFLGEVGATHVRAWIQDAIAQNTPYNEFAYEVLTASGSTREEPAAAYWKVLRAPSTAMENTTHLFLGVRFNCNKCHDHPFERWTQDQYYQMTAFFAQVGRKEDPDFASQRIGGSAVDSAQPLVEIVFDTNRGETTHERTGRVSPPVVPYGEIDPSLAAKSRREQVARWITAADNRYFASSYVNRLWGYMLGIGLIDPIDDIRAGNPPTNPELLDALTRDFVDSGFDVQHMLRVICQSRTYQHSVKTNSWNADDTINYSHAQPRRLPAEVLFDAIHQATGSKTRIEGLPVGMRAAEFPDAGIPIPFLDDFGRPPRESSCECERSSGVVLGPIMKLINGPTVNDALVDPRNHLTTLATDQPDDHKLVEEVFLRFLSRRPTEDEFRLGVESLRAAKDDERLARELLERHKRQLATRFNEWQASLPTPTVWASLKDIQFSSTAGASFHQDRDGVIHVSGPREKDTYVLVGQGDLDRVSGIRLEAFPDESLDNGGPGRAQNGNFVVTELQVSIQSDSQSQKASVVALQNPIASFSQSGWNVRGAIDGDPASGWAIMPKFNQHHSAIFETTEMIELTPQTRITFKIDQQYSDGQHSLGKFRLSITQSVPVTSGSPLPENIAQIVSRPVDERAADQQQALFDYYMNQDTEFRRLTETLRTATAQSEQYRLTGVQDLAWALINTPAFLFNR